MSWLAALGWFGFGVLVGAMVRPIYQRLWPFLHPAQARRLRELHALCDRRQAEIDRRVQEMVAKHAPHVVNGDAHFT